MTRSRVIKTILLGSSLVISVVLAGAPFAAGDEQGSDHNVVRRLDASEVKARSYRVADLFGESDEEKQARLLREQKEQSQDSQIAAAQQKIDDLENSLRRLTGQIEQQDHKISELNARIDHMQKDFDYKLCTLAAQQLGEQSGSGGLSCGGQDAQASAPAPQGMITGATSAYSPPPADSSGQEPIHLAPPPGVLGTLPANGAPAAPSATASPNKAKFDAAMTLMTRTQYDEARGAFRAFADKFPDDPLTPVAVYWIGDIAYVQKDYANAARAFIEEIKKYPDSPRGPESMLKLGQSLVAMGQKKEGCNAFAALPTKFPSASKTVLTRAADARKSAGCK